MSVRYSKCAVKWFHGSVELAGTLDIYLIGSLELLGGMSFEIGSFDIGKVGGTLAGEYDGLGEGHKVGSFSGTHLCINYAGGDGRASHQRT